VLLHSHVGSICIGEQVPTDLSISLFLALNAKGGEYKRPSKRTAPPPYFLKTFLNKIAFAKILLTAKGRTFSG
jgi:hypothetical protein